MLITRVQHEVQIIILGQAQYELDLSQNKPIMKLVQLELQVVAIASRTRSIVTGTRRTF